MMKTSLLSAALFAAAPAVTLAELIGFSNGIGLNAKEITPTENGEITRDDARDDFTHTLRVTGMRDGQSIKQASLSCELDEEMIEFKNDLLFLHFQGRDFDHPDYHESVVQKCDVAIIIGNKDKKKPDVPASTKITLNSKKSGLKNGGWHVITNDQRYQSLNHTAEVTWDIQVGPDMPANGIPNGQLETWIGNCPLQNTQNNEVCQKLGIEITLDENDGHLMTIKSKVKSAFMEGMPMKLTLIFPQNGELTKPLTVDAKPVTWMADNKAKTVKGLPAKYEFLRKDGQIPNELIPASVNNRNQNAPVRPQRDPNDPNDPDVSGLTFEDSSLVIPMKMSTSFRLGFPNEYYGPSFDDVDSIQASSMKKGHSSSEQFWTASIKRFCLGSVIGERFKQETHENERYEWSDLMKDCMLDSEEEGSSSSLWTKVTKKKPVFMADDLFFGIKGERSFSRSSGVSLDERTTIMDSINLLDASKAIQKSRTDKSAMILVELEMTNRRAQGSSNNNPQKYAKSLVKLSLDTSMSIAWLSFVDVKAGKNDGIPIAMNGNAYGYGKSSKYDKTKERDMDVLPAVKNMAPVDLNCYGVCPNHGQWLMYVKDVNHEHATQATQETREKLGRMSQYDKQHGFYLYQEWKAKEDKPALTMSRLSAHPKNPIERTTVSIRYQEPGNEDGLIREVVSWDMAIVPWDGEKWFWTGLGCFLGIVFLQGVSCWVASKRNPVNQD